MTIPALVLAAVLPLAQEPPAAPAEQESARSALSPESHIEAGLTAFRKRRFRQAQDHFEQAVAAEPENAAANFYLAYTVYKIAEPKRPFHPEKQKAADLFAKAYSLDPTFKPVWRR
jgi:Tfp pilus assembly protein PilF